MSTPTTLELPPGVRRTSVVCPRGTFAALEALAPGGATERGTALLVPGYTGSKEDFIPVLGLLAGAGRRVVAVDQRGQYQTPGPDDPEAYDPAELGKDIASVARATATVHLLGHSFGGLVAREAVLAGSYNPGSLTLLCSGPAALTGPRADELRYTLEFVAGVAPSDLGDKIAEIWHGVLEPQAIADGTPAFIREFVGERLLANNPVGLVTMAGHLLTAADKTADLGKRDIAALVLYGENDNGWPLTRQDDMAQRLCARHASIPGAAHSPAVEAPAALAAQLTAFWNAAEGSRD
jgi:pimeloyl-ACP methyl ester carboxylesterase